MMKIHDLFIRAILPCALILLTAGYAFAQKEVPSDITDRLSAIYEDQAFTARSYRADWLPDGSWLKQEFRQETNEEALVRYTPDSDKGQVLITASGLTDTQKKGRTVMDTHMQSPDGKKLLIRTTTIHESGQQTDFWVFDLNTRQVEPVMAGANNHFSPDGERILFTDQGNLRVYNIREQKLTNLTHDALPGSVTYGQASWSPDGQKIVFLQSDVSKIRKRSMLIPDDPSYPGIRETRFARVGEIIASLKIGVVDVHGQATRWLPVPIPAEGFYTGEIGWAGNATEVVVEQLSRFRDQRQVFLIHTENGHISTIFQEYDPAWVVASYGTNLGIDWIRNHTGFLILSEQEGWRHAFRYNRDGSGQENLTPGSYDIISRLALDHAGGWFYFLASPDDGTRSYLYRVSLEGGSPERLTPADQPGTHSYQLSPDAQLAFHTWSTVNTPPVTELISLPDHRVIKVLEDNRELEKKTRNWQPVEFFQVDIGDDIRIDGWMIKPADFDASLKYPVFIYVYGEPHSQTVRDVWGNAMADYHRVIADLGYLVISMDNRGTPCPKGAAWRRAIAGSLGPLSTEEQAAALKAFAQAHAYADLSRVGIWGWSGGGSNTLNALFRKPDLYHLGIAVVPKPIPHLYNAWFQEIYMKTQAVNPEGYARSAPIHFAEGLKGNLLIVTGSGETNTHVQIVEGLVDRLIELGKPFDYMAYPNRDHGLREGKGTSFHLRAYMARYLINHLEPGGK